MQPGGHKRCLKEQKRNVHAYARGLWKKNGLNPNGQPVVISYNPYRSNTFIVKDTGQPIFGADIIKIEDNRVLAWGIK